MTAPTQLQQLVERFDYNLANYKRGVYNETQVRREFIDPLFKIMGWDIDNEKGYAEAYKEVVHEDAIRVGRATKAPDYSFRVGGVRKFFLEAKKPSINIKDDTHPAYQLRRYAWSAKLPLSILTDFEEFAVYDCRIRPVKTDQAATARIMYLTYADYPEKWPELVEIFSPDAIRKGAFDKYVEAKKSKRGTAEVDNAFLQEIERWRELLARNLALRNNLSQRQLNFAVQNIIDRIIFLRIAEDRGIEPYGQLMALQNGGQAYERFMQFCRRADDRYNSGLFYFQEEKGRADAPDMLTPGLQVDDKLLQDIFKHMYYPDSPYEFSVLPADILGQVYEQYLGKVIRLTAGGHRAVVEDKPEVKKAGGVFYTPTYIVDYIVRQTVGHLAAGKTPNQLRGAKPFRILDPACGSGSFLLGAYQYLLDRHRDWYAANDPEKWARGRSPRLYQSQSGEWKLTTDERKEILLTHIFGVDIDPQAVEVTKLSLLLKVLEGEDEQTLGRQLAMFQERVLPDLGHNVKCGNSLIGPDFYDGQPTQMSFLDEDEMYRINVFDWETEFAEIMQGGGFNAVIGNPPYIFTREQLSSTERQYFSFKYEASWEKHNTFMLFMESMLRLLNRTGKGGFIVPNSWLTIESAHLLREVFIPHLEIIADLNYTVFERVSMEPSIFVVSGNELTDPVLVLRAPSKDKFVSSQFFKVERNRWLEEPGQRIVFSDTTEAVKIIDKIVENSLTINDVFDVRSGLQAYERGKGKPPQTARDVKEHVFDRDEWEDENSFRYLQGKDVGRYSINWSGQWLQYGPWLSQPREIGIFTRPRLLLREITSDLPYCLNATYISDPFLNNKSILNILHPDDTIDSLKCLLGILNSSLMSLFYKQRAVKSARKIFPKVVIRNLREFPFPDIQDASKYDSLIGHVERMLDLHNQFSQVQVPQTKRMLQRQIEVTDRRIDNLVYELYRLTEEEIKIVEESVGGPSPPSPLSQNLGEGESAVPA